MRELCQHKSADAVTARTLRYALDPELCPEEAARELFQLAGEDHRVLERALHRIERGLPESSRQGERARQVLEGALLRLPVHARPGESGRPTCA